MVPVCPVEGGMTLRSQYAGRRAVRAIQEPGHLLFGCSACACHGTHSLAQGEGFFLRVGHSLLLEEGNSVYLGEINFP